MLMVEVYKTSNELLSLPTEEVEGYIKNGGQKYISKIVNLETTPIVKENRYNRKSEWGGSEYIPSKFGVDVNGTYYNLGGGYQVSKQLKDSLEDRSFTLALEMESFGLYQAMIYHILKNRYCFNQVSYIKNPKELFNLILEEDLDGTFKDTFMNYYKVVTEIRETVRIKGGESASDSIKHERDVLKRKLVLILAEKNISRDMQEIEDEN